MTFKHQLRTILAGLAALATSAAFAQSNVSIYGILDLNVSAINNYNGTTESVKLLNSGGRSSGRWGLRGSEDLGDGLSAFFQLESQINADTGTSDSEYWGRLSFVGLRGKFGEVRVGRDYAPIFYAESSVEPLGCCRLGHGSFLSANPNGAPNAGGRVNNSVAYWGKFGDFRASLQYGLGEVPGSDSAGRQLGLNAMYTAGPVHVTAAYHNNNDGSVGRITSHMIGGRYTLGDAKLYAAYHVSQSRDFANPANDSKYNFMWAGASYDVTPAIELIGAVYRRDTRGNSNDATLYVVGGNYKLSRRTEIYLDYGHISNGSEGSFGVDAYSSTLLGGSQSHTQLGIRHRF